MIVVCKLLDLGHAVLGHAELGQRFWDMRNWDSGSGTCGTGTVFFCDSLHEKDESVKM